MNLAIFDIDGTLSETDKIDDICFVQALADAFAITDISTNWSEYTHTTDSAIIFDIFQERHNRVPEEKELLEFKKHFVRLLKDYQIKDSSLFAEITGASLMLKRLNQETEWRVAIASGSWRDSAILKLSAAGIELNNIPASFADDGYSREEIMKSAISKAEETYQEYDFAKIVSIGDGLWDVRAARNLAFPFLGIGVGERERKLRRAGTTHVMKDFADYEKLVRNLTEAQVPQAETVL